MRPLNEGARDRADFELMREANAQPRQRRLQLPACDRCTQGVMDATNSHYLGVCECPCHKSGPESVERLDQAGGDAGN